MTVSSDAFVISLLSAPCFKYQLKTWHEHELENFLFINARLNDEGL